MSLTRWWRVFFPPTPESLLKDIRVHELTLAQISINMRAYENFLPNVRLELRDSHHHTLAFGRDGKAARWDLWFDGTWIGGKFGPSKPKFFASMWLFTHLTLKEALNLYKEKSLQPVSGLTATNLQEESRALQWLQTSFKVLEGALESCRKNSGQLVVANFKMDPNSFHLQCFNLDITIVFREEGFMSVVVFDDKNQGQGSAQNPSLLADFATLKPAVLDEFIKLSSLILRASEARYES